MHPDIVQTCKCNPFTDEFDIEDFTQGTQPLRLPPGARWGEF
jgi:hypothetical protein